MDNDDGVRIDDVLHELINNKSSEAKVAILSILPYNVIILNQ